MTKHLCIKKEDGLYLVQPTMEYLTDRDFTTVGASQLHFNGAAFNQHRQDYKRHLQSLPAIKCTDGFIEGGEYEEGEFEVNNRWGTDRNGNYARKAAILLPALKEDSGLSLWMEVIKDIERAQFIEEKYIATIDRLSTNYTITKK